MSTGVHGQTIEHPPGVLNLMYIILDKCMFEVSYVQCTCTAVGSVYEFDCFQAYSKVKQVQRLFLHALDKSLSAPALCPGSLPRAGVDARKKNIVASHNDSDLAF